MAGLAPAGSALLCGRPQSVGPAEQNRLLACPGTCKFALLGVSKTVPLQGRLLGSKTSSSGAQNELWKASLATKIALGTLRPAHKASAGPYKSHLGPCFTRQGRTNRTLGCRRGARSHLGQPKSRPRPPKNPESGILPYTFPQTDKRSFRDR